MQRQGRYPPPPGASDIPGLEVAGTIEEVGRMFSDLAGRRPGLRAACRAAATPSTARRRRRSACRSRAGSTGARGGDSRNHLHRLDQRVRARTARLRGEIDADPRRLERHRHDGHSAGEGARRARVRDGRVRREVRGVRGARAPSARSTTGRPISSRRCARRPAARGVDVVLDMVGGDYLQRNIESLAMEGRLVQIGQLGGPKAQINMIPVLQRRLTITGSTLRARSVAEKGAIAQAVHEHVWPLFESRRGQGARPRDVSASRRRRGAPRDGIERAHRQARARGVISRDTWNTSGSARPA